ncbi:hypothetical protein HPB52_017422 [Rhipicephalus sanguineus]|uniref:Peptidase M14 domain-containing protein n=1 Tax=Rhipicephalus sanguineus TaxID=34632 RepID=A0A9D4PKC8_RHISA|nr:hypothetical protein HPB52_017422 [Rhipicephalus sanguineus]
MTREVVLHLVEYMVDHAQSDPDVHWLLNNARLHVVPSVNIDGSDASIPGDCSGMTGGVVKGCYTTGMRCITAFTHGAQSPEDGLT